LDALDYLFTILVLPDSQKRVALVRFLFFLFQQLRKLLVKILFHLDDRGRFHLFFLDLPQRTIRNHVYHIAFAAKGFYLLAIINRNMRGQLSAEMLILIVVVLAVLAIVATQVLGVAEQGSERVGQQSERIFDRAANTRLSAGAACQQDDDCESNYCVNNYCE
jgi:hypothetical protein